MEKIKKFLFHFFVPNDSNNYRSRVISHDLLTFYLVFAFLITLLFKNFPVSFNNVLGFATDISVEKLYQLTNSEREKNHLSNLKYNDKLAQAAYSKAKDMFAKNYWAHYAPDGKTPWDFILNSGYQYEYAGENLAKNFLFSQAVVDAWMNSPTHKENVLRNTYSEVGFAIVNGVLNGEETTLVVQVFGSPLAESSLPVVKKETPQVLSKTNEQIVESTQLSKFQPVKPKINLLPFSFNATYIFIFFLILTLVVDFYFASKLNIVRIHGKNVAHLIFLIFLAVSVSLIIAKSGAIL